MLGFVVHIVLVSLLFLSLVLLFYVEYSENGLKFSRYSFKSIFFLIYGLFAFVWGCIFVLPYQYYQAFPPETIEKDGITYYLTDDKSKEKIEEYGHEYILRGDNDD